MCNQQAMDALDEYITQPTPVVIDERPVESNETLDAWITRVQDLPHEKLEQEFRKEFCRRNPGVERSMTLSGRDGNTLEVAIGDGFVQDIGPVAVFKHLQRIRIGYQPVGSTVRTLSDLRPLQNLTELNYVDIEFCPQLRDLTPLYNKPLWHLSLYATPLPELSWIGSTQIRSLNIGGRDTPIDLGFLKGSKIERLECNESEVNDLSPLRGLQITYLSCVTTNVKDLKPLINMPLHTLKIRGTLINDLTPLRSIPELRVLNTDLQNHQELEFVRSLKWINEVNEQPRASLQTLFQRVRFGNAK